MKYIAGIDIGNSSTEVGIIRHDQESWQFVASSLFQTTGLKGTTENIPGIIRALERGVENAGIAVDELDLLLLNEAAPVIGDVAMETITETIITESTMIGHDPSTPGGVGIGTGTIVDIMESQQTHSKGEDIIFRIPNEVDFADAAAIINDWVEQGFDIQGAILQKDDAVLVSNRCEIDIPIVDEVTEIDEVPLGQPAAIEVASSGQTIDTLSNPYGIATLFELTAEETQKIIPVARALVGNKSGVVIKTPEGDVEERSIPAGSLTVIGEDGSKSTVDTEDGAHVIREAVSNLRPLKDVVGESGTNIGGMLNRARTEMSEITNQDPNSIQIRDILAVDTIVPQAVKGAVAGEYRMENAVALASMVKTNRLPMEQIAEELEQELAVDVHIQGIEASMAVLGSLTTPGTDFPIAILDIGGGSTDAAYMNEHKEIESIHLAGAGDLVTMLIDSELGLEDRKTAEEIKKHPAAKVETLFSIRHEDGTVDFLETAVDPELFGKVVLLKDDGEMEPINTDHSLEEIRTTRREAKEKVFVTNSERALRQITPSLNIRHLPFVVMVGRSALDFEIPEMISDTLAEYGIVCGSGNIREEQGPRNAVATGLVLSHIDGDSFLDFELPDELSTSITEKVATDE
ncbi:diol dehydratase reactivase subunit alpha [Haladaptatus sp. CMAA 1911]|uniref:diol dehydratase reactivase subunit alpha n=1 Tax=unclassified Haladaptatus TaxID=2622732 RepID=UPI003754BD69